MSLPRARPLALTLSFLLLLARSSLAAPPPLRGVAVDETLEGEAVLAEALNEALLRAQGLPVFARLRVEHSELEPVPGDFRFDLLDARLERYRTKGVPVLLALGGPLPGAADVDAWRRFLRALVERCRGAVVAYELGEMPAAGPAPAVKDYAFAIKLTAVQVRAADPEAFFLQGSLRGEDLAWQESLYAEDVAAYVDAVVLSAAAPGADDALPRLKALVEREDPTASIVVSGLALDPDPAAAARSLLASQLDRLGSRAPLTSYTGTVAALARSLRAVDQVKDVLTSEIVPLEDGAARLKLAKGDEDVTASLAHVLLYNLDTFSTYLVYHGASGASGRLAVELGDPTGRKPILRDALSAKRGPLPGFAWDKGASVTRVEVPLEERPLLVDFSYGEDAAPAARTEVTARALPTVGEVVFRHQQAQAAQDARLKTYVASARIENHFRPNATDSGFDVVTENRFFSDKDGTEWEETSFTLNGSRWGKNRPPFPLLQAEKVQSLPLDLRLTRDYRYRLTGLEKVGDRECYAVRFEPLSEERSLYRGTVWLDAQTFVKLKVQAVQTRLEAPVVSNEEIQLFTPEASVEGLPLYLMSRFTSRQIMLIAGRNLLVERIAQLSGFEVNVPDFAERRTRARAGDNIMYRDTDQGVRYLVKKGDGREVQERPVTSAKALALGASFDPSYDFPLPIVGINYLDFDFLGKDRQLALLFGGVLVLANVQQPKAIGNKVDLSLDLFAIAVRANDQVFDAEGERLDARLKSRPFSTGINMGYQITSFQKLIGSYQFRFDDYARDEDHTAPEFVVPADTVTNGFGLGYEYRRGGYSLLLGGSADRRSPWRPWGTGEEYDPDQQSYQKYSASLSKDFFFRSIHKVHLNLAYFGGRHLDRFSKYQFGMFDDNKIRGVPSAGIRFGELCMFRGGYSFNILDLYRLDLFLDQALGRAGGKSTPWESITGVGLGLNLKAPFGTLLRGEIGKSFLPEAYRGSGSVVGQILVLKPF